MADYQVRRWDAWHRHMALVMVAMLFLLKERLATSRSTYAADVMAIISCYHDRMRIASIIHERHRLRTWLLASGSGTVDMTSRINTRN